MRAQLEGRLDQQMSHLEVYSCAGRDVHPDDIPQMGASLLEWSRSAASLMGQLSEQLARFKTQQDE